MKPQKFPNDSRIVVVQNNTVNSDWDWIIGKFGNVDGYDDADGHYETPYAITLEDGTFIEMSEEELDFA